MLLLQKKNALTHHQQRELIVRKELIGGLVILMPNTLNTNTNSL